MERLTKLTPGLRKLVNRHVREWGMAGHEEDMYQEALLAVIHAIDRGESAEVFGVHAYRAIYRYARSQWRHVNRRDEALDEWAPEAVRQSGDPADLYEAQETINALLDLPPREREILLREAFGQTPEEIAPLMNLSRQRVGQLRDRAVGWVATA